MSISAEPGSDAPRPTLNALVRDPRLALAFGLGAGLVPKAPGTVGSLLAIPLHLLTMGWAMPARVLVIALAFAIGVAVCDHAARVLRTPDHPGIVWDEVVGCLVALLITPTGWVGLAAAFGLFRLLDIWKPWPIRVADRRIHGGFGIMLDDLLAGAGAAAILWLARLFGAPL